MQTLQAVRRRPSTPHKHPALWKVRPPAPGQGVAHSRCSRGTGSLAPAGARAAEPSQAAPWATGGGLLTPRERPGEGGILLGPCPRCSAPAQPPETATSVVPLTWHRTLWFYHLVSNPSCV